MANYLLPGESRQDVVSEIEATLDQIHAGTIPWTKWQEGALDCAIRSVNSGFYTLAMGYVMEAAEDELGFRTRRRAGFLGLMSIVNRARLLH